MRKLHLEFEGSSYVAAAGTLWRICTWLSPSSVPVTTREELYGRPLSHHPVSASYIDSETQPAV